MYTFLDVVLGTEVAVEVDLSLGDYFQVGVYNDGCEVKTSQKGISSRCGYCEYLIQNVPLSCCVERSKPKYRGPSDEAMV
jgi:hypothetical protein